MFSRRFSISCLMTLSMSCATSEAADLLGHTFPGTSLVATTLDLNATASSVNFTGSSASREALPDELAINTATGATNAATAVSNNSFFQFSITPNAGYELDLSELAFQVATASPGAPNNGYVVRSSVDGFSSDLESGPIPTDYPTYTSITVNLSGSGFQNLLSQTTFRIYTWLDAAEPNPAAAYDNIVLRGTVVPVPEPGTWFLGASSLAMVIISRRWRR
jgi:hypothetical protein